MGALAGRHAVVTGGGTGIGAAIAAALAAEGARLTLMGRRPEPLQATAAALPEARALPCDVTDEEAVAAAFADAAARGGPVTLLVNNAGAAESAPLPRTSLALFRRMLDVNLTGAFLCSRAALPGMIEAGFGRIVNVASTAGLRGYPYVAAYCAAKHGLVGLTRALALELARRPVTVNAVCPGYTETALVEGALDTIAGKTGRSRDEAKAELVRGNPQGRLVQPEEVAAAVAFLCRPENASITGQALAVAGGEVT
jgi:NAD(P)-dependent dehydrogenase (short-subunit alcohol dehydrogenase family)